MRCCVAGVHAPAFVERPGSGAWRPYRDGVSPGFTPRPSLSGPLGKTLGAGVMTSFRGVAGVHAPAFVERGLPMTAVTGENLCRRGSRPGLR